MRDVCQMKSIQRFCAVHQRETHDFDDNFRRKKVNERQVAVRMIQYMLYDSAFMHEFRKSILQTFDLVTEPFEIVLGFYAKLVEAFLINGVNFSRAFAQLSTLATRARDFLD